MPNPKSNESKSEFISRCIGEVIKEGTTNDSSQAAAICYTKWDEYKNNYEMEKKLKEVEFILQDEQGNIIGDVDLISLVSEPAIELSAQFFSKEKKQEIFAKTNEEKQIITAPVMIPDKRILRMDEITGEYYNCWFSVETIEKAAQLFAKNGGFLKTSLEHMPEKTTSAYVFESWIVGENDKIYELGYTKEEVPFGSWCASFKVESKEFWNLLKEMKNKNENFGFSIESIFATKDAFASVEEIIEQTIKNESKEKVESPVEEILEEENIEIPKSKSKRQMARDILEEILNSDKIGKDDMVRLISKLAENL